MYEDAWPSGTDTDTSSDSMNADVDWSDLAGMSPGEIDCHLYTDYGRSKKRWRRYT